MNNLNQAQKLKSRLESRRFVEANVTVVKVKRDNDIYNCRVTGFLNDFATVSTPFAGLAWEFTWQSVESAIKTGAILLA